MGKAAPALLALQVIILAILSPVTLAFWRLECAGVLTRGNIDPITSPGGISAHEHNVHGGNGFSASATTESLLASTCNSCEIQQDHSAYWEPSLYFFDSSTGRSEPVPELSHTTYYKYTPVRRYDGALINPEAMPNGLRIISGDADRRSTSLPNPDPMSDRSQEAQAQRAIGFNCLNYQAPGEPALGRNSLPDKNFIDGRCRDGLRAEVLFPYCWNGELDSPDHKSHLAFPSDGQGGGQCPPGYDRAISQLFFETVYPVQNYVGRPGYYHLSNGDATGLSMHGDVMIAWEEGVLAQAISMCGPVEGAGQSGLPSQCPVFRLSSQYEQRGCQI